MTPGASVAVAGYNVAVAPIWQSRLRRLVALAALFAGFTQHGLVRWVLVGAFVVIVVVDVALQERDRRVGRQ